MKLLTAQQVARQWGISTQRVYELTRRNLIPVIVLGDRQYRYDPEALEKFIKQGGSHSLSSALSGD